MCGLSDSTKKMSMAEQYPIKIIENVGVSPPPNSVPISSLPLSFLDIQWRFATFSQRVFFYEFPHPNPDFIQTIVPELKSSLSIALEKFYPFAAKIVVPSLPDKPRILYTEGDSVPFTVAESTADFHEVTSNDPQDVKLLHPLVPQLPPWRILEEGTCTISPLIAVQVTLFPNTGMCIGLRFNHSVCDGRSFQHFLKSWGSICRTGNLQISLPFFDRSVIKDPNDLETTFLKVWWDVASKDPNPSPPRCHTDQRATFVFSRGKINRLKSWISNQSTILGLEPMKISSFAGVCAFTWVCIVKSTLDDEDEDGSNKPQLRRFRFPVDCRSRLETPLPETYFGNCLVSRHVALEKDVLVGPDGTVLAANAIAQKVKELENGGADRCMVGGPGTARRFGVPLSVAGSPRLAVYDTDFGWGRPKKSAVVHIDISWSISLEESRDEEGGMEIGVALSKASMDAFTTLFNQLESFVS